MNASEMMNSWVSNGKLALAPAHEFGEITKRAYAKTGEQNLSAIKDYMNFGLRGVKSLSEVRDPRTLVEQQLKLAKEAGDMMLASTEAYAKLLNETQVEISAWAEKATSVAVATTDPVLEKAA